jgi:hypothetical protein
MNNIINKIIYVVVYIILLVTTVYFFGDYTKQLLILQFTNKKVVLGKITNIEYNLGQPSAFSTYTIDYTFSYNGKKYDESFDKFAIFYRFYLPGYRYEPGYSVQVLYNTDNNFFHLRQELPLQIVKSIILWILLPLFPIIIFDRIKFGIIIKRIEKKYDPQAEPGRNMVKVLLGCAILCAPFLLVKLYVVIRDADIRIGVFAFQFLVVVLLICAFFILFKYVVGIGGVKDKNCQNNANLDTVWETDDTVTDDNSPIKIHNTAVDDVVNTISKYTFENPLMVYDIDYDIGYRYYCRLFVSEDKNLFVDNMEESPGPCIFAYKINNDTITLIIKHFADGYNEITGKPCQEIKYFYVELKDVKGEIMSEWHEINAINLDGFTINGAYIVGDTVNIMFEPSLNFGIYATLSENSEHGNYIITGIDDRREKINDMNDFWYTIEYENKKLWVYGYYICFWNGISLLAQQ